MDIKKWKYSSNFKGRRPQIEYLFRDGDVEVIATLADQDQLKKSREDRISAYQSALEEIKKKKSEDK